MCLHRALVFFGWGYPVPRFLIEGDGRAVFFLTELSRHRSVPFYLRLSPSLRLSLSLSRSSRTTFFMKYGVCHFFRTTQRVSSPSRRSHPAPHGPTSLGPTWSHPTSIDVTARSPGMSVINGVHFAFFVCSDRFTPPQKVVRRFSSTLAPYAALNRARRCGRARAVPLRAPGVSCAK